MIVKEKIYSIKITEKELRNPKIRSGLIALVKERIRTNKHKKHIMISSVEHEILRKDWSWTPVEKYAPKKKDRLAGEVGKFQGKKLCMRGGK